jgi:hypothetical protein
VPRINAILGFMDAGFLLNHKLTLCDQKRYETYVIAI